MNAEEREHLQQLRAASFETLFSPEFRAACRWAVDEVQQLRRQVHAYAASLADGSAARDVLAQHDLGGESGGA